MKYMIAVLVLNLLVFAAHAAPLYMEQVNSYTADEKKLQETHKQIKERKEVELKENIFVSPFHKRNLKKMTDNKSFCHSCHQDPPHNKDERKRSFLNMHSRSVSCETCHFSPENIRLEYRWLNFNSAGNETSAKRITPFYNDEAVIMFSDHEQAIQAKEKWDTGSSLKQAELKLRLHAPLSKQGPECVDCHNSKKPLLDLKSLDFTQKEISKLQRHAIPRFFERFTKEEQRLRMSDLLQ